MPFPVNQYAILCVFPSEKDKTMFMTISMREHKPCWQSEIWKWQSLVHRHHYHG